MTRARINILMFFLTFTTYSMAQTSPLAKGKWAKIAVKKQGIFKLTGTQLRTLGFSLPIASNQIQLFGYDQVHLTEKVPTAPKVGLAENALKINDGGDGQIDELDHILFYADGSVQWLSNDTKHFDHLVTDSVFYFLTIGNNGKRITTQNIQGSNYENRTLFTQHILFEKDSVSLLNSGKVLWGAPMGVGQGKQSQFTYPMNTAGMNAQSSIKAYAHLASTSYTTGGQFDFYWNDQLAHTTKLQPVSGFLFDDIAKEAVDSFILNNAQTWPSKSNLKVGYTSASTSATGWIDYVELNVYKPIGFWQDSSVAFSIEKDFQKGQIVNCKIQDIDATSIIWNVTNPESPLQVDLQFENTSSASFIQQVDTIVRFFGVKQNALESPILMGAIANQDIVNITGEVNYVIVAAPAYMEQAKKYQQFQEATFGRKTSVVNAKLLYNEFSGGQPSPIAIRNYLKYLSNRALQNKFKAPEYLLLIGMGNFNPKKLNIDFELPVYENNNSTSILSSFSSDDFFAILENNDDINNYNAVKRLNIATGRIPARTSAEADSVIDKLIYYQLNKSGGAWENKITWIADDGDYNLHLQDAEYIVNRLQSKAPQWNHNKIYLDLFPAVSTSSGNTFPLASNTLQQVVRDGTLLINYTGHGNYLRLSEESVIVQSQFESWDNKDKLPLLVTASCNFAPYDQPNLNAIAWDAFMKNSKGVIGLVAANRLVFAYSNKQINDLFIQQLLVSDSAGRKNSIGQALLAAKNLSWSQGGDRVNDFKFSIIGDPAMLLQAPNNKIVVESLGGKPFNGKDSLLSGSAYQIKGFIQKGSSILTSFNGVLSLTIYDAVKFKNTLANQTTSMVVPIAVQENILFNGKSTVKNGQFSADFILPTQVTNTSSPIKFELAAASGENDAILILDTIFVKPNQYLNNKDTLGPTMTPYLNDPNFKQGKWAAPNSELNILLWDSSGIQTSGNALGHDLAIWIDKNPIPILLNNYFIANLDSYKSGKVVFTLPTFSAGTHSIIIKAWDLLGNGSKDTLTFEVPKSNEILFRNASNFPNPFKVQTKFGFETNQIGKPIDIILNVYSQDGILHYSNKWSVANPNTQIYMDWNGRSNSGNMIPPGVYHYQFIIKSELGTNILANSFIKL